MPAATDKDGVIANQVFLGIPWKNAKKKYERISDELNKKYPLSFIIVGRNDGQDADDLLELITDRIDSSSYAIFDATGGNPNVSLEYGLAEGLDVPCVLYLCIHRAAARKANDSAIISDLAGKKRKNYTTEDSLRTLLTEFAKEHAFTIKFERVINKKYSHAERGAKKRARALALKVIHLLDGLKQIRRADIFHNLQADSAEYKPHEIDAMIRLLHGEKLIQSQQGPHARVHIIYE